jgi:hypothetical protein
MDLDFRYASATVAAVLESILHLGETVEIHTAPDKTEFDIVIRSNKLIAIIAELRNP